MLKQFTGVSHQLLFDSKQKSEKFETILNISGKKKTYIYIYTIRTRNQELFWQLLYKQECYILESSKMFEYSFQWPLHENSALTQETIGKRRKIV